MSKKLNVELDIVSSNNGSEEQLEDVTFEFNEEEMEKLQLFASKMNMTNEEALEFLIRKICEDNSFLANIEDSNVQE